MGTTHAIADSKSVILVLANEMEFSFLIVNLNVWIKSGRDGQLRRFVLDE